MKTQVRTGQVLTALGLWLVLMPIAFLAYELTNRTSPGIAQILVMAIAYGACSLMVRIILGRKPVPDDLTVIIVVPVFVVATSAAAMYAWVVMLH